MSSQLLEQLTNISGVTYGVAGLVAAVVLFAKLNRGPNLDAFPTVGSSTWIGSWWAASKFLMNGQTVIREGYEKYKSAPFKIAELTHWTVILSDPTYVEELARAADDEFSITEVFSETRYTIGDEIVDNPFHIGLVRSQLTRNIPVLHHEITDEMVASFKEHLNLKGNEWKTVPAITTMGKVVCRMSNRVFVGLPLCRNPEWVDLNVRYTMDAATAMAVVGMFPKFMKRLAARFLTNIPSNVELGLKLLGPMIQERLKYLNEYGKEWDDKPNDYLSWLMDAAKASDLAPESLTHRMLVVNFVSIHTTTHSFTQALLYLAAHPQYIQPLREEIEGIVAEEGWTRVALGKMRKVDSFIRECQRMEGPSSVTLVRKAMKDYTFSDGTFIPKGTMVGAAALSVHHDENFYKNPGVFNPFRFVDDREDDKSGMKYQYTSISTEYLPFGLGKHACPGRFFAGYELKNMLAHVAVTYDVKLEDNVVPPKSLRLAFQTLVNPSAKIMIRNRVK